VGAVLPVARGARPVPPAPGADGPATSASLSGEVGGHCTHRWLLEPPNGEPRTVWRGRCKHCGEGRTWPVEPDCRELAPGEGIQFWLGRQEMDELLAAATA